MKLEQPELPLLFSETVVPDIFFAEYLSQMPSSSVKVYLYMIFLSKYKKDIKLNDLSKKLALPLKDINDAISYLESNSLIVKKTTGYMLSNLQEQTLNKLYKPNFFKLGNSTLALSIACFMVFVPTSSYFLASFASPTPAESKTINIILLNIFIPP